ncbi:hypothetical protein AB9F29_20910 [Falsihalocynthiibacter sp. S25ZX9]|uniref:hypothetical protein n=1 Tax=Falsihalocynthiibacter sp. S25ZX9 TaxID=3240870 RepID=UPI0035102AA8
MKSAKFIWKLVFILFLLLSLTLNVAMFVGGSLYKMASSAFGAATGVRTVAAQHADEIADLSGDLANERKLKRELTGEVADISDNLVAEKKVSRSLKGEVTDLTGDLAAEKTARRKLKSEVADLSGDLASERIASKAARNQLTDVGADVVTYRGKKMAKNQAVELTADSISKRAVKTSSRSIGSMAGEAIPYIGTAVIVGVTSMELKDLCDTIKDMNELKRSFNPEMENGDNQTTVCSMKVPTAGELWESTKASPELAWEAAKNATPSLEEIQNYEFPDVDWTGAWNSTIAGTGSAWSATKDGAGAAMDATTMTASDWWDGATKYWSEDSEGELIEE